MDPTQQSAMDEILGLAMGRLQDPLKGFEPMAERARSQFQTQTIPSLAERFTSMGEGAQRSSGFQRALGGAGVDLEEAHAKASPTSGWRRPAAMGLMTMTGLAAFWMTLWTQSISTCMRKPAAL